MFYGCRSFNSDVSRWDVSRAGQSLDGMLGMFGGGCDSFDREFVAAWPLWGEQMVKRLFGEADSE
jgi:surface protein